MCVYFDMQEKWMSIKFVQVGLYLVKNSLDISILKNEWTILLYSKTKVDY